MYNDKRYIITKALKIKDNEFIPFWELTYTKSEMYGEGYEYNDSYRVSYNDLVNCYWDTKKHKLLLGIVKDIYPEITSYKKDEDVYLEVDYSTYKEETIEEVLFEEYDSEVITLSKLIESNRFGILNNEEKTSLDTSTILELRHWKPYYKLYSGEVIKWDYKLKHKYKKNK